jgi:hypothetical protein
MSADPQFAIIPLAGPAPANAIVVGNLAAVMENLPDTIARNNTEQRIAGAVAALAQSEADLWTANRHPSRRRRFCVGLSG